jgi:glutamate---cysteine ligase / carboxylate-amine ligase
MIYFDVRLSASYPTVEFRVADVGQEVSDSVLLAALCRADVDTAVGTPTPDVTVARLRAGREYATDRPDRTLGLG